MGSAASGASSLSLPSWLVAAAVSQEAPGDARLELGNAVERELPGGGSHSYQIPLKAGAFLQLVVDQRGTDVEVVLFGPDGEKLIEVNALPAGTGREFVPWIVVKSGQHRCEVRSPDKEAPTGKYEIRIETLRPAKAEDEVRVSAEKAYSEGERLRQDSSAESQQRAIKSYEEARKCWRQLTERGREAAALTRIGEAYYQLDDLKKPIDYFEQALVLWRSVGDRRGEAETLNNIGVVCISSGEREKALEYLVMSLPIRREVGDRVGEAQTLNNMGAVYDFLGAKQKALDCYVQVLALLRAQGERYGEAATLNNVGFLYNSLGESSRALECYTEALRIWRSIGDRRFEARTLSSMGNVYFEMGQKETALESYTHALEVHRAVGDRSSEAYTLDSIGSVHRELGQLEKALEEHRQALSLRRLVKDRSGEGYTLTNLGIDSALSGDLDAALELLQEALALRRSLKERWEEALTLYQLARVERRRGNLSEARVDVQTVLEIAEELRARLESSDLRASYFAAVQKHYELLIGILMQLHEGQPDQGYASLALEANERARSRGLLDLLAEAGANIREGAEPAVLEREKSLSRGVRLHAEQLSRLLKGEHREDQAAKVRKAMESTLWELEATRAEIRARSPRYAALTQPEPLTASEIQRLVVDRDSVLLEYALGDERSFLWAVRANSVEVYGLPKRSEVEAAARRVYELLTARNRLVKFETREQRRARVALADAEYGKAALALSRMVLRPVAPELGKKRLLIVSDGALQYVPFGALPDPMDGEQPLMAKHEVVSLPSASVLAVLRRELAGRRPATRTLAVLADPVFEREDERVRRRVAVRSRVEASLNAPSASGGQPGLSEGELVRSARQVGLAEGAELRIPRLPFTRREAKTILALAPPDGRKGALDFEASRATATSGELGQYRFVHFATHGFLNSSHPELSGLVLSLVDETGAEQDGFLPAMEVFNLKLPADVVVLSGCRTGLGKEIRGEGLVGLTRGFLYAGAARVVVSLWDVHDEATAELMGRFYRGMLKDRLTPAAALRAAQVSVRRQKRWQAPYYWAPFVLQGEPR